MTPMHWVAFYQDSASIRALAGKGARLSFDFQDCSPIDIAGFRGHRVIVNLFLKLYFRDLNLDEYDQNPPNLADAINNFYEFASVHMGLNNKVQPEDEESKRALTTDENGNEFVALRAIETKDLT